MSTLAAAASDPLEAWMRFREQYAAHREGHTPPDLYKTEDNWAHRLHGLLDLSSPGEVTWEFWGLWPKVIKELDAKEIRVSPANFKGQNVNAAGGGGGVLL